MSFTVLTLSALALNRRRRGSGRHCAGDLRVVFLRGRNGNRVLPTLQRLRYDAVTTGSMGLGFAILGHVLAVEGHVLDEPWFEPGVGSVGVVAGCALGLVDGKAVVVVCHCCEG